MAYNKTVWANDVAPAINADNLNNIENRIKEMDAYASGGMNENFVKATNSPVNLIKRDYLISGEYVNTDGTIKTSSDWCRTDYIGVEVSTAYTGRNVGLSAFYDENYNFISYVSRFTYTQTTPANAKYVRCSVLVANKNTCVLVKGNSVPSTTDDGFLEFGDEFMKQFGKYSDVFIWDVGNVSVDKDGYSITFPARTAFQSYTTGKYVLVTASAAKTYTLADGKCLVLNADFSGNVTATNFDDVISEETTANMKDGVVVFVRIGYKVYSQIANLYIQDGKTVGVGNQSIFSWFSATVNSGDYSITFPARTVFQSYLTGKYILINASSAKTYTLTDGQRLVLNTDFSRDVTFTNFDDAISVITASMATDFVTVISRVANNLHSDIEEISESIKGNSADGEGIPKTPVIVEKLSDLAPTIWPLLKNKNQDVNIVMLGDSLSTALGYEASQRSDAKYRPPLMTEYTYPSYIEEQLRWDGQVYNRFDVSDVFTEVCTSAETLEQDTEHWDWASNNNRPAITRCLSGTNCSVSFEFDADYKRIDYIYRTDCTNPADARVTISAGNGNVLVYDEESEDWVEANGFTFSAQESSIPITSSYAGTPLMKSMYQKRLKFLWVSSAVSDCKITITNNGEGRLTYWGIQKSKRTVMLNFINSSRGGHSCERIKPFEEWDVDYWKPQLILWEPPYFNHLGVDICDSNYEPLTGRQTVANFVSRFSTYIQALLDKTYAPKVIAWSMWLAGNTVHSLSTDGNYLFGIDTEGNYVSTRMYIDGIEMMAAGKNIPFIDFLALFRDYAFKYAEYRQMNNIEAATITASGITGDTWTVDGGHLNDRGQWVLKEMFGTFFLQ